MIKIKTKEQINKMEKAGEIATKTLQEVLKNVSVGISTLELDKIAEKSIVSQGAFPGFKTVDDYQFTTCINVNEGIVHGLPGAYKLKKGDLVSIDLGAMYEGMHSDLSYTVEVESNNEEKFLETGKFALNEAIKICKQGNRIGDVSNVMQSIVEDAGWSVSRMLVGHGIGNELHEEPYVPCYGQKGKGPKIKPGMAFAVEIIYQKGKPRIKVLNDEWTIVTADGSLAGLFEKTVVITNDGNKVLTNY